MTLQKIEFEYDIPGGYRFVRYGCPEYKESYLEKNKVRIAMHDFVNEWPIVEKIPETESKKHRWHDLMIEFANDKTLRFEFKDRNTKLWQDAPDDPSFFEDLEYRKKQTKKTVRFRNYLKEDGYVGVANIKSNAPGFKEWLGDWQEIEI